MFSVKAAVQATGLSPDALRAWERRYGAVAPKRDARGRRVYAQAEVARLRVLHQVVALGHPIHRVARLPAAALEQILAEARDSDMDRRAGRMVEEVLEAVASYRPDLCDELLGIALAGLSPQAAVRLVLAPALVEAGERWHRGELSAAQEHLLTANVERLVMATMHAFQKAARGPGMVFGTLAGERHAIGSLLAAFIAAGRGVRAIYLGPDLPAAELAQAALKSGATVVALSLVTPLADTRAQLAELCGRLDAKAEVWLGGAAARALTTGALASNCMLFEDYQGFVEHIELLGHMRGQ